MLQTHEARLKIRLDRIENYFVSKHSGLLNSKGAERWYPLEGMLSHSWQAWCVFCRDVFIESCLGSQTVGGLITVPDLDWISDKRVSYIASCHAKNILPKVGRTTTSLRQEITWGDVASLMKAINAMKPSNHTSLLSGFGLSVNGAKHMQLVRNSCAHINHENLNSVKNLSIYYSGIGLRHPSDLMLWDDPTLGYPAFISWLNDIKIMSNLVVQ